MAFTDISAAHGEGQAGQGTAPGLPSFDRGTCTALKPKPPSTPSPPTSSNLFARRSNQNGRSGPPCQKQAVQDRVSDQDHRFRVEVEKNEPVPPAPCKRSRSRGIGFRHKFFSAPVTSEADSGIKPDEEKPPPEVPDAPRTRSQSLASTFRRRFWSSSSVAPETVNDLTPDEKEIPAQSRHRSRLRLPVPSSSLFMPTATPKEPNLDAQVRALMEAPLHQELPPPIRFPSKVISCYECEALVNEHIMRKVMMEPPPAERIAAQQDMRRRGRSTPGPRRSHRVTKADTELAMGGPLAAEALAHGVAGPGPLAARGASSATGSIAQQFGDMGDAMLGVCLGCLIVCG